MSDFNLCPTDQFNLTFHHVFPFLICLRAFLPFFTVFFVCLYKSAHHKSLSASPDCLAYLLIKRALLPFGPPPPPLSHLSLSARAGLMNEKLQN